MAKMEHLRSFFIERLTSAAGEIYEAVRETVSEYQEEIERVKQENLHLRRVLSEVNACTSRERLSPGIKLTQAGGAPHEQNFRQRPLSSDPSVLQLKLGLITTREDGEQLLPLEDLSTSTTSAYDNQTGQAISQELPNLSQDPLDSNPSIIQVKVELSTVHQDAEPQELLSDAPSSQSALTPCSKEPPHHFSGKPAKEEKVDSGLQNTDTTIKIEPLDSRVSYLDNAMSVAPRENRTKNRLQDLRNNQSGCSSSVLLSSDISSQAERNFQSQTAEGFFCCKHCGKRFGSCKQLKQHLIVHQKDRPRPYRCDLCGNSYSHAQVLENHRRTHTGERPYDCRFCGRCFKQKAHLNDHERIHTGERPFSCSVCGRSFIQSSQLKRHFRSHHLAK